MDLGDLDQEALNQGLGRSTRFQRDDASREGERKAMHDAIFGASTEDVADRHCRNPL